MRNFLGMEIKGDIIHGDQTVPQRPQEEFAWLLEAVLTDPIILGVAWTQYTPYYNDGDPCRFSVGDIYLSLKESSSPEDYDYSWQEYEAEYNNRYWLNDWDEEFQTRIGRLNRKWDAGSWSWEGDPDKLPNPSLFKAYHALCEPINKREFHNVLLDLFGDHAIIIVDKASGKIIIEGYEHD